MKKKDFMFVGIVAVLALAQLACSLTSKLNPLEVEEALSPQPPHVEQSAPTPNPEESQGENQSPEFCKETFNANANIANGQTYAPDENFQVVWTIKNTGECAWSADYTMNLLGGDINTAESLLPLGTAVAPGGTATLSVDMQAPSQPGRYISIWKMQNAQGREFGQDEPPNSPLRVAIKVLSSGQGNQGGNPTPVPEENADMLISGSDQTLLDGQCFDLNTGSEVDCSDSAADIMYQFSPIQSGKILGQNNVHLANNRDDEPDKADCEAELYPPFGHSALEDKFFCFQISSIINTTYGWIRVERFDQDGITFDFLTFKADQPEMQPINPNVLIQNQGEQVTMLVDECYDLHNGSVIDCSEPFAIFTYHQATMKSPQVMRINGLDPSISFAAAVSTEPSKMDCEAAVGSGRTVIWPLEDTAYYCYAYTPGMVTYVGWLRPTDHDTNGITFDYRTWDAAP